MHNRRHWPRRYRCSGADLHRSSCRLGRRTPKHQRILKTVEGKGQRQLTQTAKSCLGGQSVLRPQAALAMLRDGSISQTSNSSSVWGTLARILLSDHQGCAVTLARVSFKSSACGFFGSNWRAAATAFCASEKRDCIPSVAARFTHASVNAGAARTASRKCFSASLESPCCEARKPS